MREGWRGVAAEEAWLQLRIYRCGVPDALPCIGALLQSADFRPSNPLVPRCGFALSWPLTRGCETFLFCFLGCEEWGCEAAGIVRLGSEAFLSWRHEDTVMCCFDEETDGRKDRRKGVRHSDRVSGWSKVFNEGRRVFRRTCFGSNLGSDNFSIFLKKQGWKFFGRNWKEKNSPKCQNNGPWKSLHLCGHFTGDKWLEQIGTSFPFPSSMWTLHEGRA